MERLLVHLLLIPMSQHPSCEPGITGVDDVKQGGAARVCMLHPPPPPLRRQNAIDLGQGAQAELNCLLLNQHPEFRRRLCELLLAAAKVFAAHETVLLTIPNHLETFVEDFPFYIEQLYEMNFIDPSEETSDEVSEGVSEMEE